MSDNLREALEKLAERAETAEESGGTPPGEWMNGFNDGKAAVAESLRTILAAHPADTETEWGVGAKGASAGWAEDSEAEAYEVCRNIDRQVVSRQVTPWQVSK